MPLPLTSRSMNCWGSSGQPTVSSADMVRPMKCRSGNWNTRPACAWP